MDKKYSIAFATGSRADYGIVRNYLSKLDADESIDLKILVTGSLLSNDYGHQVDLIKADGFSIDAEIDIELNSSTNAGVLHSMAIAEDRFGRLFEGRKYDLVVILGDRYEMLSVAIAAAIQQIPILHIHGGEATYGNYDEFIRHAITKMSLFHFTATEEYRQRVIQLGEDPDRVFYLGALGAENCLLINEKNIPDSILNLPRKKYFVVLFHPETLTISDPLFQINELLNSIKDYKDDYMFVFLGSNADTHSDVIRNRVKEYVKAEQNAMYFENVHSDAYHYLLKNSICLIGNSSSGLIEAPSLGIFTINIGDRQAGRVRGNSVVDVKCNKEDIADAIRRVLSTYMVIAPLNPYLQENSAERYYQTTKSILRKLPLIKCVPKRFYDIQNQ